VQVEEAEAVEAAVVFPLVEQAVAETERDTLVVLTVLQEHNLLVAVVAVVILMEETVVVEQCGLGMSSSGVK
jgi:hypothetical protein